MTYKGEREQTTIRLPVELYNKLAEISKHTGLTVTALIIASIWWRVLKPKYLRQ